MIGKLPLGTIWHREKSDRKLACQRHAILVRQDHAIGKHDQRVSSVHPLASPLIEIIDATGPRSNSLSLSLPLSPDILERPWPRPVSLRVRYYEKELDKLQVELSHLQDWVKLLRRARRHRARGPRRRRQGRAHQGDDRPG